MRPPPNDFAEIAQGVSVRALCRRFGVGQRTITRWRRECGVTEKAPAQATATRRSKSPVA